MSLPVLAMRPHFVEKLWGGARLRELPAKARPAHAPPEGLVGESWEVADIPEGASFIEGGPLDGMTLRDAVAAHGHALTGPRATPGPDGTLRFPLLVKLIDAQQDLSIQVHPDSAYARAHPGTHSKDEAWLVVACQGGARMLHGLKKGVSKDAFARAIADGSVEGLLRDVAVLPGDVLRVPPGTVHAVGAGCLLLEVQEPSDTTFRVFDFNRVDARGQRRALHVEQALEVATFGTQPPALHPRDADGVLRLEAARFALEVGPVPAEGRALHAEGPFVVFAVDGALVLEDAHGAHGVPRGGCAIVPPLAHATLRAASKRATAALMAPR